MPPVAARVVVYATFCVAFGRVAVVTLGGGTTTVKLRACVAVRAFTSLTCTVKLVVPALVGVPEMAPVPALRVNPAGRLPTVTDQV